MGLSSNLLGPASFRTTQWSVVLAAGGPQPDARAALEALCRTYWRPVYGFIRRRGYDAERAKDLTQGFFALFLERRDVEGVDPDRGRFRAFLLAATKNFLSNERERERALKRGGGATPLSLTPDPDAELPWTEPADERTPEVEFEREWALTLLGRTLEQLRTEQTAKGREGLFERLKPTLAGGAVAGGYAEVAEALGLTTVAVKVEVHRLKQRYRNLLLTEIARTVELPQQIDDELNHLFRALEG